MKTYQAPTNKKKEIKLPSSIEQISWTRRTAAPGASVGLQVLTKFVGNGSTLQIDLSDGNGKKLGTFKESIAGNRFWAQIAVPGKAESALIATAKLPKHGLEMTSPALLLTPTVEIRNLHWSAEEARRGDILTLKAEVRGAPDGTSVELSIWEHDADGAHDLVTILPTLVQAEKIQAEWEFVFLEDTDDIPTAEESERGYRWPEYFFRVTVHGASAESELLKFKDWIELRLFDEAEQPLGNVDFVLILPDGQERRGQLDADAYARVDGVPPGRCRVQYVIPEDR